MGLPSDISRQMPYANSWGSRVLRKFNRWTHERIAVAVSPIRHRISLTRVNYRNYFCGPRVRYECLCMCACACVRLYVYECVCTCVRLWLRVKLIALSRFPRYEGNPWLWSIKCNDKNTSNTSCYEFSRKITFFSFIYFILYIRGPWPCLKCKYSNVSRLSSS